MLRLGRAVAAVFAVGALGTVVGGAAAQAECRIKMLGEFPLTQNHGRPWIKATINGQDARLLADTGAFTTSISSGDAARIGVASGMVQGLSVYGVGGKTAAKATTLDYRVGKTELKESTLVLDGEASHDLPRAIWGRDLLMQHDLEFDLANHALRILQPEGCQAAQLIYWNKPYSQAKLQSDGSDRSEILIDVMLNGHVIPALLDSGASMSVVTPEAAALAGVRFDQAAEHGQAHGIGHNTVEDRIAEFDSFTVGDETIQHVKIQIADLWKYNKIEKTGSRLGYDQSLRQPKMLLGADFLQAHRLIIAHGLNLVLFSYVGGPVFDVSPQPAAAPPAATPPPQTAVEGR
jgi:predicted aspartyl protease